MPTSRPSRRLRKSSLLSWTLLATVFVLSILPGVSSSSTQRTVRRSSDPSRPVRRGPPSKRDATTIPLKISNNCADTIWPGIASQAGTGPGLGGFELSTGTSMSLLVSADWQGRVWGRTNCSFNVGGTGPSNLNGNNGNGQACITGDCNGVLDCVVTGDTPVTLAEFDLSGGVNNGQTFYDISLVDGYNIPMGLTYIPSNSTALQAIPPNLSNPACIATAGLLAAISDSGTEGNSTNSTYPIPYESTQTNDTVADWCPWDLQLTPPDKPGDGVYPYPDSNIQRPAFDPCFSACAKTNSDSDCCTGSYDTSAACKPSLYSQMAKGVCPDAYSYAFDDTTSTFIIPNGGGWEVVFCPTGRSTNILKTFGAQLSELASTGVVSKEILEDAQNVTLIVQVANAHSVRVGGERVAGGSLGALVVVVAWAVFW